jgi:uncharacterized protein
LIEQGEGVDVEALRGLPTPKEAMRPVAPIKTGIRTMPGGQALKNFTRVDAHAGKWMPRVIHRIGGVERDDGMAGARQVAYFPMRSGVRRFDFDRLRLTLAMAAGSATTLVQIWNEVGRRVGAIERAQQEQGEPREQAAWPCRKGCAQCCRRLAAEPVVTGAEWREVERAIDALPQEVAVAARRRIRERAGMARPVVCPLLEESAGVCLVYGARPVACRAYGYYVERGRVLGCEQIEALAAEQSEAVVWGNQEALEGKTDELGRAAPFSVWLEARARCG